jgi:hypothetical protein
VLRATLDDFKNPWKDRHLYDRESGGGYYRNAYDYDAAKRLLLDPCRSPAGSSAVLCNIDPLAHQDHSSDTTPLASDAVLVVDQRTNADTKPSVTATACAPRLTSRRPPHCGRKPRSAPRPATSRHTRCPQPRPRASAQRQGASGSGPAPG